MCHVSWKLQGTWYRCEADSSFIWQVESRGTHPEHPSKGPTSAAGQGCCHGGAEGSPSRSGAAESVGGGLHRTGEHTEEPMEVRGVWGSGNQKGGNLGTWLLVSWKGEHCRLIFQNVPSLV